LHPLSYKIRAGKQRAPQFFSIGRLKLNMSFAPGVNDQKVVRELYANKGRTVEHGFTSRPEWHGPLPERPTYCDCCIETDDGRATGRAMIPSVLNNRVYSRDDQASIKALADSRAAAMMDPTAAPQAPVAPSTFPKMGTPAGIGRMFQNAQTMFRNIRERIPAPPAMPDMPSGDAAGDVASGDAEPEVGASTENGPADEGSVPAAEAFRRRSRRMRSRAYSRAKRRVASFGTKLSSQETSLILLVGVGIAAVVVLFMIKKCLCKTKAGASFIFGSSKQSDPKFKPGGVNFDELAEATRYQTPVNVSFLGSLFKKRASTPVTRTPPPSNVPTLSATSALFS
jgi:hypothetical protein